MPFRMIWGDLARMETDAVVNAAYPTLRGGDGGVHGAICRAAGREALEAELQKTGWCDVGKAVLTPGFGLRARGIIHAVAPTWQGGRYGEAAALSQAYQSALALAAQNGYCTVAFPPLGAGDFGFPLDTAVSVAVEAIGAYLLADGDLDVTLVLEAGEPLRLPTPLRGALAAYVRENAADVSPDTPFRRAFADEPPAPAYTGIRADDDLPEWLRGFGEPKRPSGQTPAAKTPPAKPAGIATPVLSNERDGGSAAASKNAARKGLAAALGTALAVVGGLALGLLKLLAAPFRLLARVLRGLRHKLRGDEYEDTFGGADERGENRAPTATLEKASIEDLLRMLEQGPRREGLAREAGPARARKRTTPDWDETAETWAAEMETDDRKAEQLFDVSSADELENRPFAGRLLGRDTNASQVRSAARDAQAFPQTEAETLQWRARQLRQSAAPSVEQGPPPMGAAPSAPHPPRAAPAPSAMPPMEVARPAQLPSSAAPPRGITGAARSRTLQEAVAHAGDTFSQAVLYLIDERGMSDVQVYKRANIGRKLFSKLRSGKGYQPSKQTAVALCIALALNLDDALDLLARAGYTLAACNKADLIAAFFIEHGIYDIFQLNEALFAYGQPSLGA